ncbi:4Fe-4S dicluster domain-containing protein [Desulfohalovibrio reitneri]|uniref:4Fe-4S dicluster domain-containing protein n=1 Tax=Desulfohalovibrio reitneri TaxID=1307759 RepID=UPI0004A6B554|nr:4Fe-4S dicluster domain-containing protein [Desulfohalovibrio reitneri]
MEILDLTESLDREFISQVEEESGQRVRLCYQCGNCTAGCPYTFAFDIPVSRMMRLLQAGQKDQLLSSHSVWLCATCESCTTRCPNGIDVARIVDVLRHMARREGYATERGVKVFWDSFLESVAKHGRVYEMGLLTSYIAKTGKVWTDAELGPRILPKGKLHLTPSRIQGREAVARIFERYKEASK